MIYGAGLVGRNIFLHLSERYKIDFFVVTKRKEGERETFGVPIKEIAEIKYRPDDTAVMVDVDDSSQNDVLDTFQKYGFMHIVFSYIGFNKIG